MAKKLNRLGTTDVEHLELKNGSKSLSTDKIVATSTVVLCNYNGKEYLKDAIKLLSSSRFKAGVSTSFFIEGHMIIIVAPNYLWSFVFSFNWTQNVPFLILLLSTANK